MTMAVLGDLQNPTAIAHRVVVADHAILLDRQRVVEGAGGPTHEGHEGRALGFGRHGEAGVVTRHVVTAQEAIGRRHGGDAGQPQLLGQALL